MGTVAYFFDTEGNVAGIIQHEHERMTGTVLQVSVSRGGIPKRAIPSGELTETGIAGDAWRYPFHGGRRKAILLVTIEGIDELVVAGVSVVPRRAGREPHDPRSRSPRDLRIGQRLRVGDAAD